MEKSLEEKLKDKNEFSDLLNKICESALKKGLKELDEMYKDIESRYNLNNRNQLY